MCCYHQWLYVFSVYSCYRYYNTSVTVHLGRLYVLVISCSCRHIYRINLYYMHISRVYNTLHNSCIYCTSDKLRIINITVCMPKALINQNTYIHHIWSQNVQLHNICYMHVHNYNSVAIFTIYKVKLCYHLIFNALTNFSTSWYSVCNILTAYTQNIITFLYKLQPHVSEREVGKCFNGS